MVTIRSHRKTRRRNSTATFFIISLAAHLVVALGLTVMVMPSWIPKVDITWLDLDNTLGSPVPRKKKPPPPARPEPEPRPEPKGAKSDRPIKKKPAKVAKKRRKPDAGPSPDSRPPSKMASPTPAPAVANLAPGDAALMLLVRTNKILGSPYEHDVRRLLEVFYDHKTLLWSSGLDPMKDFDSLLIATPNPYRVTMTFLAAHHSLPTRKIRRALNRSARFGNKRMKWTRKGEILQGMIPSPPRLQQDPRVVILRGSMIMLTDPKHIPLLTAPGSTGKSGPDGGPPPGKTWFENLGQMALGSRDAPGLVLEAINLPRLIRLPPDIPVPLTFRVSMDAVDPVTAHGTLSFASQGDARQFLKVIPRRIKRASESILLRLLGVTDILTGIKFKRKKEIVEASLFLKGKQVRYILEVFRGLIPQVRVPGMPPRRPPDAGARKDASRNLGGVDGSPGDARSPAVEGGAASSARDASPGADAAPSTAAPADAGVKESDQQPLRQP